MREKSQHLIDNSLKVVATSIAASAVLFACSADTTISTEESVGSSSSAVHGFGVVDDPDTAVANSVVQLTSNFGNCSGILLTPQLVLTANHCIWGGEDNGDCHPAAVGHIAVGPVFNKTSNPTFFPRLNGSVEQKGLSYESRVDACLPSDHRGDDIALIYLAEPVIGSTIKAKGNSVVVPLLATLGAAFPVPPTTGLTWGSAGFGTNHDRRIKLFANGWISTDEDDGGSYFDLDIGDWEVDPGDSGGPLFTVQPDGTRRVIGVLSGKHYPAVGSDSMQWADITHSNGRGWLLDHAKEKNVAGNWHTPAWLSQHGKDPQGNDWWGLLDYSGPCRRDVDRDCDGWFDGHDNCPTIANPLQEDTGDIGTGNVCDPNRDGHGIRIPGQTIVNGATQAPGPYSGVIDETIVADGVCPSGDCPVGFCYWTTLHGPFWQNGSGSLSNDGGQGTGLGIVVAPGSPPEHDRWGIHRYANNLDTPEAPSYAPGGTMECTAFDEIQTVAAPEYCGSSLTWYSDDFGYTPSGSAPANSGFSAETLSHLFGNVSQMNMVRSETSSWPLIYNPDFLKVEPGQILSQHVVGPPNPPFYWGGLGAAAWSQGCGTNTFPMYKAINTESQDDVLLVPAEHAGKVRCFISGVSGAWSLTREGGTVQPHAEIYTDDGGDVRLKVSPDLTMQTDPTGYTNDRVVAYASCIKLLPNSSF